MTKGWGITPMEGKRNSYKFLLWRPEDKAALSLHRRELKDVKKVKDVPVHDWKAHRRLELYFNSYVGWALDDDECKA